MLKTKMKRVTLHPLLEDGSMDTSTNLYPKTLIDGIIDRLGEPVKVVTEEELVSKLKEKQDKLVAGENITIEGNVISATGGSSFEIPEYHWNTREELSQEILEDIFTNNYPLFKMFIEDDEGYEFSLLLTQTTDLPGHVKVEKRDEDYRLRSYVCIFNTAEVEKHGGSGSDDYDWGSEDYGSEDRPDGFRIDPNDEKELIIFYIAKVDGVDEYLYSIDDRELTVRANPGVSYDDPELTSIEIDGHTFRVGGGESGDVRSQQMTATIVIDPITNINGRRLSAYEYRLETREGYKVIVLSRKGNWVDYQLAAEYMEYMTGSRYVPTFDYEHPQNSVWIMADGSIWKPQWDDGWGMCLWSIPNPYSTKYNITCNFDISSDYIDIDSDTIQNILSAKPTSILINNYHEVYLQYQDTDWNNSLTYVGVYINQDNLRAPAQETCLYAIKFENKEATLRKISLGGGSDITYATDEDIDNMFIKYTKFYYNLGEGIRLSNPVSELLSGNDWGTSIYVDEPKYSISGVSVIVNGIDISGDWLEGYDRYVYDSITKTIFIPHVDKDISISVYSYNDPYYYWIESTLENCSGDGFQKYVYMGNPLSCSITLDYGYTRLEVQIQNDNYEDVTEQYYRWDENDRKGYINIQSVYEPYHIYARGIKDGDIATIYTSLENCSLTENPGQINIGESWYSELHSSSDSWAEEPLFRMIIDGYEIDILNDKEHQYVYEEKGYYIINIPNVTGDIYITGKGYQDLVNVEYLDVANNVFFAPENAGTYGYNFDYTITQIARGDTYFNTFRSNTPGTEVKLYINDAFKTNFYLNNWDGTWYYYNITEDSVSGPIRFEFDKHYVDTQFNLNGCEVITTNPERPILNQGFSCMIMPTGQYTAIQTIIYIGGDLVTDSVSHIEDGNIYVNIPSVYDNLIINATYIYQPQQYNVNFYPDENIGYSQGGTTVTEGESYVTTLWSAYEFSVTVRTGEITNYYAPEYDAGQWTLTINLTDIRDNVDITCLSSGPHAVHVNNIIGANGVYWTNDTRQFNRGDQYTNTITGPAQFHVLVTTSDGSLIIDNDSYWNGSEYTYTVDILSLETDINIAIGYSCGRGVYAASPLSYAQAGQSFGVDFISHYSFTATIYNNGIYETDMTSMEFAPGLQSSSYTINYVNGSVSANIISDAPMTYQISSNLVRCSINPNPSGVEYSSGSSYNGTITGDSGTTPVFCQVWMNGADISSGTVIQSGDEYIISIPDIQGDITILAQYDLSVVMHAVTTNFTNADFQGGPAGTITEVEDGQSLSTIIVPTIGSYNSSNCQVSMGKDDITGQAVTEEGNNYIIYIPAVADDVNIEAYYEEDKLEPEEA